MGIIANIIIFQQKNSKGLLVSKLTSDILWGGYYISLQAYSGAATAIIGVLRECVFIGQNTKKKKNKSLLLFFLALSIFSSIITWKSVSSIFPACAAIISVTSFWYSKPGFTRITAFSISLFMLTYDIMSASYMGIINEILTILSTSFSIFNSRTAR